MQFSVCMTACLSLSPAQAQYVFLHDAILEGVTSGTTEVKVEKQAEKCRELKKEDEEGESGFQKEYSVSTLLY